MGIKDLTKTIKKRSPDAITTLPLNLLPGEVYGVDVYSYLYPAKYNSTSKGKGSHIRFFFDMIISWRSASKDLIMVFDGDVQNVAAKAITAQLRTDAKIKRRDLISEIQGKILSDVLYSNLKDLTHRNLPYLSLLC